MPSLRAGPDSKVLNLILPGITKSMLVLYPHSAQVGDTHRETAHQGNATQSVTTVWMLVTYLKKLSSCSVICLIAVEKKNVLQWGGGAACGVSVSVPPGVGRPQPAALGAWSGRIHPPGLHPGRCHRCDSPKFYSSTEASLGKKGNKRLLVKGRYSHACTAVPDYQHHGSRIMVIRSTSICLPSYLLYHPCCPAQLDPEYHHCDSLQVLCSTIQLQGRRLTRRPATSGAT